MPVSYFLAPVIKLLLHCSVVGLQLVCLVITLFVQLLPIFFVRLQGDVDLLDLCVMVEEMVLLLLELFDNLLLVLIKLSIISSKMLVDSLKLLLHSIFKVCSPPLQLFDLVLQH